MMACESLWGVVLELCVVRLMPRPRISWHSNMPRGGQVEAMADLACQRGPVAPRQCSVATPGGSRQGARVVGDPLAN